MLTYAFDDGGRSIYNNAYPILESYNQKGVVYAISERVTDYYETFISHEQLLLMQDNGWEVGSHTVSHSRLTQLPKYYENEVLSDWEKISVYENTYRVSYEYDDIGLIYVNQERFWGKRSSIDDVEFNRQGYYFDEGNHFIYIHLRNEYSPEDFDIRASSAQREIQDSYIDLIEKGFEINSFVAPYGDFDESLMQFVLPYYNAIVGSKPYDQNYNFLPLTSSDSTIRLTRIRSITQETSVENIISLVEDATNKDAWIILTFHAINYNESDPYRWAPEKLEQLAAYVRDSRIAVVTISQGLSYAFIKGFNPSADFDKDGDVDGTDISFFLSQMGLEFGDTAFDYMADYNVDGVINQLDMPFFTPSVGCGE